MYLYYKYRHPPLPDELAEVDHGLRLVETDSERVGHGPEQRRTYNDIPVLDGRPLEGLMGA